MLQPAAKASYARPFLVLLALAAAAWPGELNAQGSTGNTIVSTAIQRSIPPVPDSRHVFVLDSAHLLSDAEIAALQDSARKLQASTGADVAFVTLPTLHGGAVEDAALAIGRAWKVGSSGAPGDPTRNRGLVMLYVPDKKSVAGANLRVEVGRGLEGAITDGGGSRAILEAIKPPFRAKRYGEGFVAGFDVAARLIAEEKPAQSPVVRRPPEHVIRTESGVPWELILFESVVLVMIGVIGITHWRRRSRVIDLTPRDDSSAGSRLLLLNLTQPAGQSSSSSSDGNNFGSTFDSSGSGGSSSSDGGSFGGGGGFSGGGSSDSV